MSIPVENNFIDFFEKTLPELGPFLIAKSGGSDHAQNIRVEIERRISMALGQFMPQSAIFNWQPGSSMCEELVADKVSWFVNGLDGESNFIKGIPHFSISIAAVLHNEVIASAVYDPNKQELFIATKAGGSSCNGVAISISQQKNFYQALIAIDFAPKKNDQVRTHLSTYREVLRHCQAARHFGSTALDICWVACGRFDALLMLDSDTWGIAAGSLILNEADGCCANLNTIDRDKFDIFNKSFACSNPFLFFSLLKFTEKGYQSAI